MLPAPYPRGSRLADVMPSVLASVTGEAGVLGLAAVRSAIVLLVDGLGEHMLRTSAGHARTLANAPSSVLRSGFPSTTAAALATLTTGTTPGVHGLVGYTANEPSTGRIINQLTGWQTMQDAVGWQRSQTVFERAAARGVRCVSVGAERYADSGFTAAVLRGTDYRVAASMRERLEVARDQLSTAGGIAYVYVPELDSVGHRLGWGSDKWLAALEELDSAVMDFMRHRPRGEGLVMTADHGMIDVPAHRHVYYDRSPGLLDGVDRVAGEPRGLQLHLDPTLDEARRVDVVERWRASESHRSWVLTRQEAIDAGWFGPDATAEVAPRIGDVIVAARKGIAYYDTRSASASALAMVGQHGSVTDEETRVPFVRFGAYA